jgi:hypothetical protein
MRRETMFQVSHPIASEGYDKHSCCVACTRSRRTKLLNALVQIGLSDKFATERFDAL